MTSIGEARVSWCNNAKTTPCIALFIGILSFIGCNSERDVPDVSHLDGNFQLVRTEQILFDIDSQATAESVRPFFAHHKIFWDLYFSAVMPPIDTAGDTKDRPWRSIVGDPLLRAIAGSVEKDYADMSDINAQLSSAFQYLQYYFPGNRVPNVYTLISGFGYFPFIFEDGDRDGLGISLEMFLGSNYPYSAFVGNANAFSDYLVRTYNRDHVARKTLDVMVDDLVGPAPGDRLLDVMIHNGIKLYVLEHLMPSVADTVLFEFTPAQLAWCMSNEKNLWAHLLTDDLIYSNAFSKIQKLINPAPGIPGMPVEAPGGVANWTGWRIIHALTERNRDTKMTDLLSIQDAQSVLEAARYRPK